MFLHSIVAAAALLSGTSALEQQAPANVDLAKVEKDARTRCTMRQLHAPAGRGVGIGGENCHQVARAEVAALVKSQALASNTPATTTARD